MILKSGIVLLSFFFIHLPKEYPKIDLDRLSLSIVSFDDVYLARMAHPALTTIHQDIGEKGMQAVQLVLEAAKSNEHHHTECILPLSLVERESVCERRDGS